MSPWWTALLGWALLTAAGAAAAHVASNGFLSLDVRGRTLEGSLEIAVRDAELAVGVDANHDGKVTWGELRASGPALTRYLAEHLSPRSIAPRAIALHGREHRAVGGARDERCAARCRGRSPLSLARVRAIL